MEKYLVIVFSIYLFVVFSGYWLEYLNLNYLKKYGSFIPPEFEGQIDEALLVRTRDYAVENIRFRIVSSVFNNIVLLVFIFGGFLNTYNSWVASVKLPFILAGLLFFMLLSYGGTFLSIPFSLYRTFKIEKKHGFNTMTPRLWITDLIKSILISTILMVLIISVGLWLVRSSPNFWWFWVWIFFLIFSIFIMYLSPYLIEPLFHKFTPIDEEGLGASIRNLMRKVNIRVSRVLKIDASKRSKHTNAYFTGIGKVKRIILYDTLIMKMDSEEILSVLAHEAGHWKKRHLLKHLLASEIIGLATIYIAFILVQGDFLTELFHIEENTFFAKMVVLGFLGAIVTFPLTPLINYFSRRHEIEADRFACEVTGDAGSMISALVKLSKDNLSNLHPHPLYAAFYYSHPPVVERISRMKEFNLSDRIPQEMSRSTT